MSAASPFLKALLESQVYANCIPLMADKLPEYQLAEMQLTDYIPATYRSLGLTEVLSQQAFALQSSDFFYSSSPSPIP